MESLQKYEKFRGLGHNLLKGSSILDILLYLLPKSKGDRNHVVMEALMQNNSAMPLFLALIALLFGYFLCLSISRLFFSPLANVPGPWVAAATGWYETYWDCLMQGRFMFKIEEMHKKYGPIVRISPWEVHIADPAFWDTLHTNNKLDKDAWYYRPFGDNYSTVGTVSSELHRVRRHAMAKFFSKANVSRLESKVLTVVERLCNRIEQHRQAHKVIDISNAFRCFATDVVTDYTAPHTRDFVSTPDFSAAFNLVLRDFSYFMTLHRHVPIVFPIMEAIPRWVLPLMDPSGATSAVLDNQDSLLRQAQTVIKTRGVPQEKESPTVLDAIYTSPTLGPEEKTEKRLVAEAVGVIGAGTETTGNTLSTLTFYVLSNLDVLKKLKAELTLAAKEDGKSAEDMLTLKTLDKLPYLQASIKEALRLGSSVSGRLPRANRFNAMTYSNPNGKEYTLPPNTIISTSMRDVHFSSDIFPEPRRFSPERWLNSEPEALKRMEKAFVPFGRGSRVCLGLELAKDEMTLMAGNLFYRFDLELYKTTKWDIEIQHDFFAPFGPRDSKGIRVLAK